MSTRLAHDFYAQDTIEVARQLLGKFLIHQLDNGQRLSGRIVETEAYLGVEDPAAHSFAGRRTARTEVMFAPAATAYVYFIYGMHFCFNVVTAPQGVPEAVLIRAVELYADFAAANVLKQQPLPGNGPGKVCRALLLNGTHNGLDLLNSQTLWLESDGACSDVEIVEGPRVGISQTHDAVHWPLRFGLKDSLTLSSPKFPNYTE